jgi:hypothetical protein
LLIDEAISSSILEGAQLTTRAEAKAIIRDGRTPTGRGERMVVNNYNAMRQLLNLGSRDLTLDDLFANESDPKPFVHPMVHAIGLHFWLAYLHPFVDGSPSHLQHAAGAHACSIALWWLASARDAAWRPRSHA